MKICLSFEGKNVKIVEAVKRPQGIFIQKTLTIPVDGLDSYLATTKHKNFILTADFRELFQDFLSLPPVKGPDLTRLLQNEMKRLYPDSVWIYSDLGEKVVENKRIRALSILRSRRQEVEELINKFLLHGKNIEAIYASPSCIASFIQRSEKPVLCLFESDEKNIFLLKDGAILFTRKLSTFQKGLNSIDIQGIEMSITHCIQNLRISPEEIILAGDFKEPPMSIGGVKVVQLSVPETLHYKGADINEYLIPLGSLYLTHRDSYITEEYRRFRSLKNLLRYSIITSGLLFMLCLIPVINNLLTINSLKKDFSGLFTKYRVFRTFIESYNNTVTEAKRLQPLLDFLKKEQRPPVSLVLREISDYPFNGVALKAIDLTSQGGEINLRLSGRIDSSTHKGMLLSFNKLLNSIKGKDDITVEIINKRFSISDGSFDIDLRFSQ
ncbi:MAG: hypothetical protein N2257_06465 [Thermodesulfovibrionales bacterium]|nr:hypothetical protein [Thermodesulfovibrionales bacterium]